eukprot:scpid26236/ scgid6679/ Adenylate cyclase type 9; ATP pyrophosphate-lyase 9; Adenylate cyclase type IX; Adenylyl cyclase 9
MTLSLTVSPDPAATGAPTDARVARCAKENGEIPSSHTPRASLQYMRPRTSFDVGRLPDSARRRTHISSVQFEFPSFKPSYRVFLPRRAFDGSDNCWWKPRFGQQDFENVYQKRQATVRRRSLRSACICASAIALTWLIFLVASYTPVLVVGPACYLAFCLAMWAFTYHSAYYKVEKAVALVFTAVLVAAGLAIHSFTQEHVSLVARFGIATNVLVLIYAVIPLPVHHSGLFAVFFSIAHEALEKGFEPPMHSVYGLAVLVICKVLVHLVIHLILLYGSYMLEVLKRNTFWQLGHSLLYQHDLSFELKLKEKMINSMMPQRFSEELLGNPPQMDAVSALAAPSNSSSAGSQYLSVEPHSGRTIPARPSRVLIGFRQLNLYKQDNVSILFADIVGFTRMSSNKSARDLVLLLNDLFGRFDDLALLTGCEKISTLGDCYYCVAGCPEPCKDHADRCVKMGLAIVAAIREFCVDTGESVDMRVGIHTGSVLCGAVGKKRIKFDVFSNDVRLANKLESSGVPGFVHITDATFQALLDQEDLLIRDGDAASRCPEMANMKTYLITSTSNPINMPVKCPALNVVIEESVENECLQQTPLTMQTSFSFVPNDIESDHLQVAPYAPLSVPKISAVDIMDVNPSKQQQYSESKRQQPLHRQATLPSSPRFHRASLVGEMLARADIPAPQEPGRQLEKIHSAILDGAVRQMHRMVTFFESADNVYRTIYNSDVKLEGFSWLTLSFKDSILESHYQTMAAKDDGVQVWSTFDNPRFAILLQSSMCFVSFLIASVVIYLLYGAGDIVQPVVFSVVFALFIAVWLVAGAAAYPSMVPAKWHSVLKAAMSWNWLNAFAIVLIFSPVAVISSVLPAHCPAATHDTYDGTIFIFYLIQVALVQCLSFTHFHSVLKVSSTIVIGTMAIVISKTGCGGLWHRCLPLSNHFLDNGYFQRFGDPKLFISGNITAGFCVPLLSDSVTHEIILDVILMVVILNFLNREFEVSARLNFRTNILAQVHYCEIEDLKAQADQLLSNIVPDHVVLELQQSQTYSEDHELVGVVFANITNFTDFYSESYEGGLECIRVLNELISDVDDMLESEEFSCIEKIKTIGSTYMCASGLNQSDSSSRDTAHLVSMLKFCLRMHSIVAAFNQNMLGFSFKLRIGFNYGPVTSGVVGTSKLLYDIWGD